MIIKVFNEEIELIAEEIEILNNNNISIDSDFFELLLEFYGITEFDKNLNITQRHDLLIDAIIDYSKKGITGLKEIKKDMYNEKDL